MMPLFFLHGFLGSADEWHPLLERLKTPRAVLTPDLPRATDWLSGLKRLTAQLPERCILVGYSMGARIALGMTVEFPERVRGLLLIGGHPGLEPEARDARRRHDAAVAERLLTLPPEQFLDGWYRQPVFASVDDATRSRWIHERRALDRPAQADLLRCYSLGGQPDYWPRLSQIQVPLCVVVGQQDVKYLAIARAMRQTAPQIELRIVPLAGHAVHREQPSALRVILQAFLALVPEEEDRHD
jgi:2-succinyl-6-hydroxy-2,4-cyclohexadiene-1-carboxylate synthase